MGGLSIRRRIALDIARSMRKSQKEEHPLRQLFWECTLRCNLRCQHCGSDCRQVASTPDMPKEDFFKVLDTIAAKTDPHKVFVIVSGEEPTMRADLEECGKGIYSRGFPWGMVTNGFGMTGDRFSRLLGAGLHSMAVSLDGLEEDHDWLRGRKGSFERAVGTIRVAAGSGIAFDVVTCVNRRNYPQLPHLKEFLIGLGLKEWKLFSVFPQGRAALNPDLQLPPEMFRGMLDFIRKTRKEGRIKASYGCEGNGMHLRDSEGKLMLCHLKRILDK